LAEQIPIMPGEEGSHHAEARRADALVALASAKIAEDPDPDRATVVVHAQLQTLMGEVHGCEVEEGPVIPPATARRLACTARIQSVLENGSDVVRLGRMSREPSAWMLRQLRYRDHGCTFPGCGTRRFTHAHHVVWRQNGGPTDLKNLVLVCSFHHRLVHEYGWSIQRNSDGTTRWFHPDGTRYRAGPPRPRPDPHDVREVVAV
jgi:hypothetical protein